MIFFLKLKLMKYKDLIKNLPYDLQDRILDVVFKEHKNTLQEMLPKSIKSEFGRILKNLEAEK